MRYGVRIGGSDSSDEGQIIDAGNAIFLRCPGNAHFTQSEILTISRIPGVTEEQLLAPNAHSEANALEIYRNRRENRATILRRRHKVFRRMTEDRLRERAALQELVAAHQRGIAALNQ